MRGETTPAFGEVPKGSAAVILADLSAAADGDSATEIVPPLSRAFAAILAGHPYTSQLSEEAHYTLKAALFRAEASAKAALRPSYFDERGAPGFTAAFGLLMCWAEEPGSDARATVCPEEPKAVLVLRIAANDLDTLCAADALSRIGFHMRPDHTLLPTEMLSPRAAPAATAH